MLSMAKLGSWGSGQRNASYYTDSVAKGREDYYAGKGEAPGEWAGTGAQDLGLVGEVSAGALRQISEAIDPATGERLRRPSAVTGYDLTFSAPKSVSLLYLLGDEDVAAAARQAHDEACASALGYMESHACVVRRGHAGQGERLRGGGFVAGAFVHRTSRDADPQLHTHVVVANLAKGPDGRWTAPDGRLLYRHCKPAGYVYQAELRARLTEYIGVEWQQPRNGMAEIAGVAREVIDHFSQRRRAIVSELEARGSQSAASAQQVATASRARKDYSLNLNDLGEQWRARAQEFDFRAAAISGLTGRRAVRPVPGRGELAELAAALSGPGGLTRRASTFDRRQVVEAFAAGHRYGATRERIEALADQYLASGHVVALEHPGPPDAGGVIRRADGKIVVCEREPRYSTPEMLQAEAALVAAAETRVGEGAGSVAAATVEQVLAEQDLLSDEQARLVRSLTTSGDGIQVVHAGAGTGKTTALEYARRAWVRAGYRVAGAALAATAREELAARGGIAAQTVHQTLRDLERFGAEECLDERTVMIVDEAGMVGTRQLEPIAAAARQTGAKLVLVGDTHQLPEIDAGGALRGLRSRLGATELTEVHRQRDRAERAALAEQRQGRPENWVRSMADRERLIIASDSDELQRRLVSDWRHGHDELQAQWQAGEHRERPEALIFAATRASARELNDRAQAHMRQSGVLGDTELGFGNVCFYAGDRVLCLRNAERDIGVLNGQRGTVTKVEPDSRSLRVDMDSGAEVVLPASYIEDGHLELGYAMTVHKSQAKTVERSYVLATPDYYSELAYTATTRHRDECRFYVNTGEAVDQLQLPGQEDPAERVHAEVSRWLRRERAEQMAIDVRADAEGLDRLTDSEVAERAGRLERLLRDFPAAARAADRQAAELVRRGEQIRDAEQRLAGARDERGRLGALARKQRAELGARIATQQELLDAKRGEYTGLSEAALAGQTVGERWLEDHGVDLEQAAASELELAVRRERAWREAAIRARYDTPPDLTADIGERPDSLLDAERWDRAAATLEDYRLRNGELPGAEVPADGAQRPAWERARAAVARVRGHDGRDQGAPGTIVPVELDGPDIDL